MFNVPVVLTQMLDKLALRHQLEMNRRRIPRLEICAWVIDGDVQIHAPEIEAAEAFRDVQLLGARGTDVVQPAALFETAHFDDERVPFPLPAGKAEPSGIGIFR